MSYGLLRGCPAVLRIAAVSASGYSPGMGEVLVPRISRLDGNRRAFDVPPSRPDSPATSDGADALRVPVLSDLDIIAARQEGRTLAVRLGFSSSDATIVATAISELARNIVLYANHGEIIFGVETDGDWTTLVITARDEGAGIANVALALQDGYSTSGRLGVGLPGVRRLMDAFEICSRVGGGTVVVVKKTRQRTGSDHCPPSRGSGRREDDGGAKQPSQRVESPWPNGIRLA